MKTSPRSLALALALALLATAKADNRSADYRRFEKWLQRVYAIAPRYHLKLHPGAEDEEEFFYLYCWQSADRDPVHAVHLARAFSPNRKSQIANRK